MEPVLSDYEQRIRDLESTNRALRDKLSEHDKLRKVYIEDLNGMKGSLGNLQDLLMKCRADIMCHEMLMVVDEEDGTGQPTEGSTSSGNSSAEVVSLQAQLEICKSDLTEQRAAYQELLIEKNRITSELQLLLQKNHQLSVHNAQTIRDQPLQSTRPRPLEGNSKLYGSSPAGFERHIEPCPHCNNVFGDFMTLETHIKDCPGLDY
ncbi:optineurin-like [Anopheles darlingi]|uniref:optineurin-like n=1 Tax=Anopheles darlingi TaxID=43151 RepID=UPI0021003A2E|nr:optineurin-like [Anopheles darlingi]